jgi:RND family efflux transporter, MFP subunit
LTAEDLARLRIDRGAKRGAYHPPKRWGRRLLLSSVLIAVTIGYLVKGVLLKSGFEVEVSTVSTAYPSQALTLFNASGYVVPQRKADIASKATGRLESLEVEEGNLVKKGEIIARLENQDLIASMQRAAANVEVAQAELAKARAELKDATLALKRSDTLVEKRFITKENHDAALARHDKAVAAVKSAQAAITAAEAAYHEAKVMVEYTWIRAPFDGVILAKHANIGDVVAPFASTTRSKGAVVSMADLDTLEVEADVSESNLVKIWIGQPCEIELDALPDVRLRGVVNRIVPTIDRSKATVLVKVGFVDNDGRILPEMSARAAFLSTDLSPEQQRPVLVVQAAAIASRHGKEVVFVVRGNKVSEVPIERGNQLRDLVIVKRGLTSGDKVVLKPPLKLTDGSTVSVPQS